MGRPLAPGRRMHSLSPASPPSEPVQRRVARCGMARRGWLADWCAATAAVAATSAMAVHACCRAPPVTGWPPRLEARRAHSSRGSPSLLSAAHGAAPPSHPLPAPCPWRLLHTWSRSARPWSSGDSSASSGRRTKPHGRLATTARSPPSTAWAPARSPRRGRSNARPTGHDTRRTSALSRRTPNPCRGQSGRPSHHSPTPCRPSGRPPPRPGRSAKSWADK
jgi:hypothetical protein